MFYNIVEYKVLSDKISDFKNAAKKKIKCLQLEDNVSMVVIDDINYVKYVYIYTYESKRLHLKNNNCFFSKLYTCINCEFAAWTRIQLVEFHKILNKYDKYDMTHNQIKTKLNYIEDYIKRFINILYTFLDINKHDAYFDTSMLTTFLSLQFKLHYLKSNNLIVESRDIYRIIFDTINAILNFTFLSCDFIMPTDYISSFYDLVTEIYLKDTDRILKFLDNIHPMGLESNDECDVDKILLLNIFLSDIRNVKWVYDDETVFVEDVLIQMETTYNSEVIFWYQNNIFNTIMKYILTMLYNLYVAKYDFPIKLSDNMNQLYSILSSYISLTFTFVKCITLLKSIIENKNSENEILGK